MQRFSWFTLAVAIPPFFMYICNLRKMVKNLNNMEDVLERFLKAQEAYTKIKNVEITIRKIERLISLDKLTCTIDCYDITIREFKIYDKDSITRLLILEKESNIRLKEVLEEEFNSYFI